MATCVRPPSLTSISKVDCAVQFNQLQRLGFVRMPPVGTPLFATEAAMKEKDAWVPLLEASDDTKLVITPFFVNHIIPPGEGTFAEENTNASLGGAGYFTGQNGVRPTGEFLGLPSDVYEQLLPIIDESAAELGLARMGLYAFNLKGEIISRGVNPIPFLNFFTGDPGSGGLNTKNIHNFSYSLQPGWYKGVTLLKPNFDPRIDLDA